MNKFFGYFLILVIFLSACQKKISTASIEDKKQLNLQFIDYSYFTSKSRIEYKDNANDIKATVTIRAKKDSVIWMNISKSGIAGVRILADRNSLTIVDNVNKEYIIMTYGDIQARYNLRIDFDLFQSTMLSNLLYPDAEQTITADDKGWIMMQVVDDLIIENRVQANGENLQSVLIKQEDSDNVMHLEYSDYNDVGRYRLPQEYKMKMNYKSGDERLDTDVVIKHYKAEFVEKPLNFPFKIPSKYVQI